MLFYFLGWTTGQVALVDLGIGAVFFIATLLTSLGSGAQVRTKLNEGLLTLPQARSRVISIYQDVALWSIPLLVSTIASLVVVLILLALWGLWEGLKVILFTIRTISGTPNSSNNSRSTTSSVQD
jgi:hypothetical protein